MRDTILVLTNTTEDTVESVLRRFREVGQRFVRVNTDWVGNESVWLEFAGGQIKGSVRVGEKFEADRIKSVWYRHTPPPTLKPNISPEHTEFIVGEYRSFLLSLYTAIDAFWVNPVLAVRLLGDNKLRQRLDARRRNFRVPTTLLSNDPMKIIEFCERHGGKVVLKPIRPIIMLREGEQLFVYTTPISVEDIRGREAEIRLAPVMVQEYVEKELEFRVTIVGEKVFTCAIHSQDSERTKHDWRRYDFENVKHEVYQLPVEIEQRLLALMKEWGLVYGAFDMILTPTGEYVFLEVNQAGQWGWIEYLTGMPISQAIAELLMDPPQST